eukprot:scaffold6052_cov118-Cylindrotheca_fusiformis.AAC.21
MKSQLLSTVLILLSSALSEGLQGPSASIRPQQKNLIDKNRPLTTTTTTTTNKKPTFSAVTTSNGLRGGALSLSPEALRLAETLAPKIGIFTATALYLAPASAVFDAIRADDIGDLNPVPLAIMSVVCMAWLVYGFLVQDPYVALSNIAGCISSIGYVVTILPLLQSNKPALRKTQTLIMSGVTATICLWTFLAVSGTSIAKSSSAIGIFASSLFVVMAGSPLLTIKSVVANKNSRSILGPLTIAQVVNSSLWTMYGFAVKNSFVWGPNSVVRNTSVASELHVLNLPPNVCFIIFLGSCPRTCPVDAENNVPSPKGNSPKGKGCLRPTFTT